MGADGGGGTARVTIYHNPGCGTSRRVLAAIRARGTEPVVVEYLKTPPDAATLRALLDRMGLAPSGLLRRKGALWKELGLDAPGTAEETVFAALLAHPVLMERPIVVGPHGHAVLCRPAERLDAVLDSA